MYASGLVFEAQGSVPEPAAWDDSAIMKVLCPHCSRVLVCLFVGRGGWSAHTRGDGSVPSVGTLIDRSNRLCIYIYTHT